MAKNKGNRGKNNNSNNKSNNNIQKENIIIIDTLSVDDVKLVEMAKKSMKDLNIDLVEFRKICEAEIEDQVNKTKEEKEKVIEVELIKMKSDYEDILRKENKDLVEENNKLEEENKKIEFKLNSFVNEEKKAEDKKSKLLEEAQKNAEDIIIKAKEEAEKQSEILLKEITKLNEELDIRKEKIEDKELEIETNGKYLSSKEKRLKKQEIAFETANPEALINLQKQLEINKACLEELRLEYEKVQIAYNKIKVLNIKTSGISVEELAKTNELLLIKVETLENKCNRFTEFELTDMQRALETESQYQITINNQNREIAERKAEVIKLNNGIFEYEQLKAQLDLLRTLNEHLKNEMDNTKKMLESSSGEISPALTDIDRKESEESGESYEKYRIRTEQKKLNTKITLPEIVQHVKNYAASRDNPLFYSEKDLRAFISGLASSPISIIQGLSGTGKTSLPKIFSEAIIAEINIVPVESSWRDRNELLGYYNDFSKKFTAKEFTCNLYRAGVDRYNDTPYFIVLDEMNLSRVEYYFADFLSVLEDKKSNWKIKLVDTDLRQLPTEITKEVRNALEKDSSDESKELLLIVEKLYPDMKLSDEELKRVNSNDKMQMISYLSRHNFKNAKKTRNLVGGPQHLRDGNTICIPPNVWFIGTANRDESTFEITDKVYDRAQVLNFNDRAKGERYKEQIDAKYVSYEVMTTLFNKAQVSKTYTFKAEENTLIKDIEQILKTNCRVTFGNRILDQMNKFVPVYVAAGANSNLKVGDLELEAIDYQLTNKVLRKLEYIEIKGDAIAKLKAIFEKHGLLLAKDFIDWKSRGDE